MTEELHGQGNGVGNDEEEDEILKSLRSNEPPYFVLQSPLGYVSSYRSGFESKFDAVSLILVQFTILVFLFSLILKGNYDETNENVHHEEGNHNNVDDIKDGHNWSVIHSGSCVLSIGVDGDVQELRPSFKSRDSEQRQHCITDVVEVEVIWQPFSVTDFGNLNVSSLINDVLTTAFFFSFLRIICAVIEGSFEQLDSYDSKHESQEESDEQNVTNSFDSNNDTLDNMLESFGTIDGTKWTKNPKYSQDLHDRNGTILKEE